MLSFYLSLIDDVDDKFVFESVYRSYKKQMYYVALSILGKSEDAEDAVHDVFCSIAQKHTHTIRAIKNDQDLKNYMLKSAKNMALNKQRYNKNQKAREEKLQIKIEENVSDDVFLDCICSELTYKELVKKIENLDKKYSDVLYLHFVLELPVADVAELLHRNTQTVKKQIIRGKKLLMQAVSKEEETMK